MPAPSPRFPPETASVLLIAHDVHERGGMERALAELLRRASDRVAFHVISAELEPELRSVVQWTRVRVPRRPFPVRMMSFWGLAAASARGVRADLVHTMGAIVPVRADLASVQFCHAAFQALADNPGEPLPPTRRANNAITQTLALRAERWCYRPSRTGRFAPASSGVAAELARFYPGVPSTVIPNAADHGRFRPDRAVRAAVRTRLGVTDETMVVVFLGGDWSRKGLRMTIDGVAKARRDGSTNIALWVVGRGDAERYRAYASTLEDGRWCTFQGFSREPEHFLAAADVFVSPTTYEAFPLAALEAAACGLPVVATNVNGIAELVRDGREGLIVSRDAHAIALALSRLAADPPLRETMGRAAQASASRYTWDAAVSTTLETYELLRLSRPAARDAPR
jgi:UDP-glucose:(heptosyl)LPS alpha-1,3-glucosyltransferase